MTMGTGSGPTGGWTVFSAKDVCAASFPGSSPPWAATSEIPGSTGSKSMQRRSCRAGSLLPRFPLKWEADLRNVPQTIVFPLIRNPKLWRKPAALLTVCQMRNPAVIAPRTLTADPEQRSSVLRFLHRILTAVSRQDPSALRFPIRTAFRFPPRIHPPGPAGPRHLRLYLYRTAKMCCQNVPLRRTDFLRSYL